MDITQSNWSEVDDNNSTAAPDGAPEGMPPSGLNNTMRAMMGAVKRWWGWSIPKTTAGTGTAYTLSYPVAAPAMTDGETRLVLFHADNGANPTLNENSRGASPIYRYVNGAWAQITDPGVIKAGMLRRVAYHQTSGAYRIIGPGGTAANFDVGTGANNVLQLTSSGGLPSNLPGTVPVGGVIAYVFSTAPAGWVFVGGRTIGNASSGATERANADTEALFTGLYNQFDNTKLPIQDSAGVATTRGVDAAADFAAGKRLPTLDAQGRVIAGLDNMSGTSANRLTGLSGGVDGDVIGATGGEEAHQLTIAEMPSHTHPGTAAPSGLGGTGGGSVAHYVGPTGSATGSTGGDGKHNNVQPTLVLPFIMKL